ncbi:6382_t:CDS:2, partial [Cetraspora pellucida]
QKNNEESNNEIISYFLIHISQTTKVVLNERDFYIIIVIGNSNNAFAPEFICTSDVFSSNVECSSSAAISNLYRMQLFGLENSFTQKIIQQNLKPTCSSESWNTFFLLEPIYNYNLKHQTLANIEWYQFFESWAKSENSIIELTSSLEELYPTGYIFNDRELRA